MFWATDGEPQTVNEILLMERITIMKKKFWKKIQDINIGNCKNYHQVFIFWTKDNENEQYINIYNGK